MRVIVTGTVGFDFILNYNGRFADRIMPDKIHNLSLSFFAEKLNKQFGGTAGNIAYSLKLLGMEPDLYSVAGEDFGPYATFLKARDISTSHVKIIPKLFTGLYFVTTDKNDNQIASFYAGAGMRAHDISVTKVPKSSFVVISSASVKSMMKFVAECKKNKLTYMFDPAFQIGDMSATQLKDGISHAAIFIGNDYEIALVEKKLKISHDQLRKMVPVLITTLGAKGSIIETKTERTVISPAKAKNLSDPTGAGDAYRSGFLAGYLRNFDLLTCGQMGSIAAVYTVEKYGTVTHAYTKKQFIDRFYANYKRRIAL
jgi:adenosine kinase